MKFDKLKQLLSGRRGKALLGAGLLPVALVAWHKREDISRGVKTISGKVRGKVAGADSEAPHVLELGESRKTDMVNTVRFMLSKYDTEPLSIIYVRDKKRGLMGYALRSGGDRSLFFGWSDEYAAQFPLTPFWIALDPESTRAFAEKNLKIHYDIYPHPWVEGSILISVPLEEMEDPQAVAGKIMELAGKTLR